MDIPVVENVPRELLEKFWAGVSDGLSVFWGIDSFHFDIKPADYDEQEVVVVTLEVFLHGGHYHLTLEFLDVRELTIPGSLFGSEIPIHIEYLEDSDSPRWRAELKDGFLVEAMSAAILKLDFEECYPCEEHYREQLEERRTLSATRNEPQDQ